MLERPEAVAAGVLLDELPVLVATHDDAVDVHRLRRRRTLHGTTLESTLVRARHLVLDRDPVPDREDVPALDGDIGERGVIPLDLFLGLVDAADRVDARPAGDDPVAERVVEDVEGALAPDLVGLLLDNRFVAGFGSDRF